VPPFFFPSASSAYAGVSGWQLSYSYSSSVILTQINLFRHSGVKSFRKPGKGTVIGFLYLGREDTAGQLVTLQVIGDTFTALALPGAGLIGAGAFGFIGLNVAFHQ